MTGPGGTGRCSGTRYLMPATVQTRVTSVARSVGTANVSQVSVPTPGVIAA